MNNGPWKQQAKDAAVALHNWNVARAAAVRSGDKDTVAELDANPVGTTITLPDNRYIHAVCTSMVKGRFHFYLKGKRVSEPKLDSVLGMIAIRFGVQS